MQKKAVLISESSVYTDAKKRLVVRGGGALCFHNIAKTLQRLGFEVKVFSIQEFAEQKLEEEIDRVLYKRAGVHSRNSFKVLKYLRAALKECEGQEYVFLNQFTPHLLLPWLKGRKTFAVVHDVYRVNGLRFWMQEFGFFTGLSGYFVERMQLRFDGKHAARIMTVSEATKGKLLDYLGESVGEKVFVNPYPINSEDYQVAEKDDFMLFVGRFVHYKHPEHALFALKRVKELFPDFRAVFVIPRYEVKVMKRFRAAIDKFGFTELDVECIECCEPQRLKDLLGRAKILVQPSFIEGQGIIISEALASGTPVVAYDLEAYKGVLKDGENCRLVKKDDQAAFADACLEILTNYHNFERIHVSLRGTEEFEETMKKQLFGEL